MNHASAQPGAQYLLDNLATLAAAVVFGIAGVAIFAILPLLIGALVDHLALSPRQSGFIASADVIGMATGNLAAFFWIRRINWRKMAWLAVAVLIAVNLLCATISSFQVMLVLRFLAGLAAGSCLALTYAMFGGSRHPDRNYGIFLVVTLTFGAANLFVLSKLSQSFGAAVFFVDLACIAIFAALFTRFIPETASAAGIKTVAAAESDAPSVLRGPAIIALIANLVYFIGQGGVWAYLERIGIANGLSASEVATSLSLSLLAAVAGALVATVVNLRLGRVVPLGSAILLAIASVLILMWNVTFGSFLLATCVWNFVNNYGHPYLLGYMAAIDRSGQYVVASAGMQTGGMGIGPAIAAMLIVGPMYTNVLWLGLICFAITLLLFMPIMILVRGLPDEPAAGLQSGKASSV